MKHFYSTKVIVTSLALTMLLGGGALYATKQQAQAETPDNTVKQQTAAQNKQDRFTNGKIGNEHHQVRPFGKDGEGRFGPKTAVIDEAAAVLGINKETLTASLKDKSLVDIAKGKGISEADLIAKLQAERTKKIDEAVKAGKLKAEQADKLKANMANHLKFMVNQKGIGQFHDGRGPHEGNKGMVPAPEKLAAILGISEEQLKTQLKDGKSLSDIAQAQGISKEQLVAKIKSEITPWIEKMVDHKRDTAPEGKQIKTN